MLLQEGTCQGYEPEKECFYECAPGFRPSDRQPSIKCKVMITTTRCCCYMTYTFLCALLQPRCAGAAQSVYLLLILQFAISQPYGCSLFRRTGDGPASNARCVPTATPAACIPPSTSVSQPLQLSLSVITVSVGCCVISVD